MDTEADLNEVDKEAREELARLDAALGAELRGLRSKRGMSQRELADATGIGERTIVRLESGERPMSMQQLYKLCQALGVKPSRLVRGAEDEIGIE